MTTASRKPAALNALSMSALALLLEGAMHPYEMFQVMMSRREDVIVKLRAGSLYHAVGRLADTGLVRSIGTDRDGNRPERTTYEITDAGRAALATAVAERLSVPAREYPIFPVALAELHALPVNVAVGHLRTRRAALREDHAMMQTGMTAALDRDTDPSHLLDLDYLLAQRASEIDWLTRVIDQIERGTLYWTPTAATADIDEEAHL